MAADKAMELQFQVRQNASELNDFMKDLGDWEADIKRKDEQLQKSRIVNKQNLPPIRNQVKKKSKKETQHSEQPASKERVGKNRDKTDSRISSYDYRSWDKFDVDKALQEMDEKEDMATFSSESEEEEEEEMSDEELEEQRQLQKAALEKERGNQYFKEGNYEEAINCYTQGIQLDPSNAILPANRAMALLKLNRFGAAEGDCTMAISLDPTYTKAYARRGAARLALGQLNQSMDDYQKVLQLEPSNKQAREELKKIEKNLKRKEEEERKKTEPRLPTRKPRKPAHLRSKRPLKRIFIEEIGNSSGEECDSQPALTLLAPTSSAPTKSAPTLSSVSTHSSTTSNAETVAEPEDTRQQSLFPAPSDMANATKSSNRIASLSQNSSDVEGACKIPKGSTLSATAQKLKVEDFSVPKTSVQFLTDWRKMQNSSEVMYHYLKKITPEAYPKLFQQSLEPSVLTQILGVLHEYYIVNKQPVYKELKHLAAVKRFGMAIMFLSPSEKTVIRDLFQYMRENPESSGSSSEADQNSLMKKYGVSS